MGKKSTKRKTRWRTLSIGEVPSDTEEETNSYNKYQRNSTAANIVRNGGEYPPSSRDTSTNRSTRQYHHQYHQPRSSYTNNGSSYQHHGSKYTYSSHSTPTRNRNHYYQQNGDGAKYKSSRSNSTASEPKITFNEDEYTRITTPRQDVLFKKGYLSRKRPQPPASSESGPSTAGTSTTGDGTPEHHHDQDGIEYVDSELDQSQQFIFHNGFVDQNGVYFVNGYEPFPVMLVGPAGQFIQPVEFYPQNLCYPPPTYRGKRYSTDSQTESTSPNNEENTGGECSSSNNGDPIPHINPQAVITELQQPPPLTSQPAIFHPALPPPPAPHLMYPGGYVYPPNHQQMYTMNGVNLQCSTSVNGTVDPNKRYKKKRKRRKVPRPQNEATTDDYSDESGASSDEIESESGTEEEQQEETKLVNNQQKHCVISFDKTMTQAVSDVTAPCGFDQSNVIKEQTNEADSQEVFNANVNQIEVVNNLSNVPNACLESNEEDDVFTISKSDAQETIMPQHEAQIDIPSIETNDDHVCNGYTNDSQALTVEQSNVSNIPENVAEAVNNENVEDTVISQENTESKSEVLLRGIELSGNKPEENETSDDKQIKTTIYKVDAEEFVPMALRKVDPAETDEKSKEELRVKFENYLKRQESLESPNAFELQLTKIASTQQVEEFVPNSDYSSPPEFIPRSYGSTPGEFVPNFVQHNGGSYPPNKANFMHHNGHFVPRKSNYNNYGYNKRNYARNDRYYHRNNSEHYRNGYKRTFVPKEQEYNSNQHDICNGQSENVEVNPNNEEVVNESKPINEIKSEPISTQTEPQLESPVKTIEQVAPQTVKPLEKVQQTTVTSSPKKIQQKRIPVEQAFNISPKISNASRSIPTQAQNKSEPSINKNYAQILRKTQKPVTFKANKFSPENKKPASILVEKEELSNGVNKSIQNKSPAKSQLIDEWISVPSRHKRKNKTLHNNNKSYTSESETETQTPDERGTNEYSISDVMVEEKHSTDSVAPTEEKEVIVANKVEPVPQKKEDVTVKKDVLKQKKDTVKKETKQRKEETVTKTEYMKHTVKEDVSVKPKDKKENEVVIETGVKEVVTSDTDKNDSKVCLVNGATPKTKKLKSKKIKKDQKSPLNAKNVSKLSFDIGESIDNLRKQSEVDDKTNSEISEEIDRMIQKGLYANLEERLKSMGGQSCNFLSMSDPLTSLGGFASLKPFDNGNRSPTIDKVIKLDQNIMETLSKCQKMFAYKNMVEPLCMRNSFVNKEDGIKLFNEDEIKSSKDETKDKMASVENDLKGKKIVGKNKSSKKSKSSSKLEKETSVENLKENKETNKKVNTEKQGQQKESKKKATSPKEKSKDTCDKNDSVTTQAENQTESQETENKKIKNETKKINKRKSKQILEGETKTEHITNGAVKLIQEPCNNMAEKADDVKENCNENENSDHIDSKNDLKTENNLKKDSEQSGEISENMKIPNGDVIKDKDDTEYLVTTIELNQDNIVITQEPQSSCNDFKIETASTLKSSEIENDENSQTQSLTEVVKHWLHETREKSPELEVLKSPERLLSEKQAQELKKLAEESDSENEAEVGKLKRTGPKNAVGNPLFAASVNETQGNSLCSENVNICIGKTEEMFDTANLRSVIVDDALVNRRVASCDEKLRKNVQNENLKGNIGKCLEVDENTDVIKDISPEIELCTEVCELFKTTSGDLKSETPNIEESEEVRENFLPEVKGPIGVVRETSINRLNNCEIGVTVSDVCIVKRNFLPSDIGVVNIEYEKQNGFARNTTNGNKLTPINSELSRNLSNCNGSTMNGNSRCIEMNILGKEKQFQRDKSENDFRETTFSCPNTRENSVEPDLLDCWDNDMESKNDNEVSQTVESKRNLGKLNIKNKVNELVTDSNKNVNASENSVSLSNEKEKSDIKQKIIDEDGEDVLEIYESVYGKNLDYLEIKQAIESESSAHHLKFPPGGEGVVPCGAVCCNVM